MNKFKYYFVPRNVYVVEEGALVRGARQKPWILRKVIAKYGIKTIVCLDDKLVRKGGVKSRNPRPYQVERDIAKAANVQYFGYNWKGTGIGPLDEYLQVADLLASPEHQPIFFHCQRGRMRTSAALAAYWIRHHGYSADRAVERLVREYEFKPDEEPAFVGHMREFEILQRNHPKPGSDGENKN